MDSLQKPTRTFRRLCHIKVHSIVLSLALCTAIRPAIGDLIPRQLLFEDAKYSSVSLSPDGRFVGFLSQNELGVRNVYIQCTTCANATPVTFENRDHIGVYHWTGLPNIILYQHDRDLRLYKINITNASPSNTAQELSDDALVMADGCRDQRVLLVVSENDSNFYNIYEMDLLSKEKRRILNNSRFEEICIFFDNDLRIRLVSEESSDGSLFYYRPADGADPRNLTSEPEDWTEYLRIPMKERAFMRPVPIGFSANNEQVYWKWGGGSAFGQLVVHQFGHPEQNRVLYTARHAEIREVIFHPTTRTVFAIAEANHKPNTTLYAPIHDLNTWLISYDSSDRPIEYFLYDWRQMRADFLFSERPALAGRRLNQMVGFEFAARDGLRIQAYLCLPPNTTLIGSDQAGAEPARMKLANLNLLPVHPQKLVVYVHDGPYWRDIRGFDADNAWLTDRGYAVLRVNFRGSTTFGIQFENAGNGEWGGKMQTDLLDAVDYLVRFGVVDSQKVAIVGHSYGGYAALAGMTFTPNTFACGVDMMGPSNLITFQKSLPTQWTSLYQLLAAKLGGYGDTNATRQFLKSRSPFFFAENVRKPLLVVHGTDDRRVHQDQSDQFVKALRNNGTPVTYVLFSDEGHFLSKPANKMALAGLIEKQLHDCLGGHLEPYQLGQYNSSAVLVDDLPAIDTDEAQKP